MIKLEQKVTIHMRPTSSHHMNYMENETSKGTSKKSKFKCELRERAHTFLFENNPKRACNKCTQEHSYHRQIGGRPRSRERAAANQMPKE